MRIKQHRSLRDILRHNNACDAIFGVIYGRFGDDYGRTIELGGLPKPTREVVVEVAHRFRLTKFAYIQPDIQFISRPGGTGTIDDAVVIGVQMGVTF